jgi:hypothetical protein
MKDWYSSEIEYASSASDYLALAVFEQTPILTVRVCQLSVCFRSYWCFIGDDISAYKADINDVCSCDF